MLVGVVLQRTRKAYLKSVKPGKLEKIFQNTYWKMAQSITITLVIPQLHIYTK
jgi:hypothetical protein